MILTWMWRLPSPHSAGLLVVLLIVPMWAYLHRYFGLYDSHRLEGLRQVAKVTLTASTLGFILIAMTLLVTEMPEMIPVLSRFTAAWILVVLLTRSLLYGFLHMIRKRGGDARHVCVIGSREKAVEIARQFRSRPEWGLRVSMVGLGPPETREFFRFAEAVFGSTGDPSSAERIGTDLREVLHNEIIDEILITSRPEDVSGERPAIHFCKEYGIQCRVQLLGDELLGDELEAISGDSGRTHFTWTVNEAQLNARTLWVKRCVDILVSGLLLLVLAPMLAVLAVLVKLSSPGPVFFTQVRTGLRGRKFVMVKFRTMIAGAESMLQLVAHRNITGGPVFKDPRDWRVTPIGRIFRRFSLDEFPQLWNVFRGDMSLVGPRPLPVHESNAIMGLHRRRFSMRPGITCTWQVAGRNNISFARWMELDVEYVDNWSLLEDIKLLVRTIPAVLSGRGAY